MAKTKLDKALELMKQAENFSSSDLSDERRHSAGMDESWGQPGALRAAVEGEQYALRKKAKKLLKEVNDDLKNSITIGDGVALTLAEMAHLADLLHIVGPVIESHPELFTVGDRNVTTASTTALHKVLASIDVKLAHAELAKQMPPKSPEVEVSLQRHELVELVAYYGIKAGEAMSSGHNRDVVESWEAKEQKYKRLLVTLDKASSVDDSDD